MPSAEKVAKGVKNWERQFDANSKKVLEASIKLVEPVARKNLARQPVPNRPGLIERRGGAEPSIVLNYSTFPWAAGAELGSKRYPQFKRYVGSLEDGYIVGEAVRATEKTVAAAAVKKMESELKEEL